MSTQVLIKSRLENFRKSNPESNFWDLGIHSVKAVWRLIVARFYLRKCTALGKMISVLGKPIIGNQGEMSFGDEVRIWSPIVQTKLYTGKGAKLIVGNNSRLNGVHIDARKLVCIGNNVRIAPYTVILDSDFHDLKDHFSMGPSRPVIIEDDVWLATRSTILKGVTIGRGAVVAAGAVVTKDVPPYCIAAGVPARVIRKLL